MGDAKDYFKHLDFNREWEEEDWEKYFEAQERLVQEVYWVFPRVRSSADSGLGFRQVLRRFGLDPDRLGFTPVEHIPTSLQAQPFWVEGAEVDQVPVYASTRSFAHAVMALCSARFKNLEKKIYRLAALQQHQKRVRDLRWHATRAPGHLTAGHALGYGRSGIKGNIVQCRQALAQVDACLGLLSRLDKRLLPLKDQQPLFKQGVRLRNHLLTWVHFLRHHFSPSE